MSEGKQEYEDIKRMKRALFFQYQIDANSLNHFHDKVMKYIFHLAVERLGQKNVPCEFVWFITGSGGRLEQGYVSDQDHGIIYADHSKEAITYFHELGKELSYGLYKVGYPYCEGKIMPSNPVWCKSVVEWQQQLSSWMVEETWETIRYLQIFFDSRVLIGSNSLIRELKLLLLTSLNENLLRRHLENILYVKKAIGPLGQLVGEEKGEYEGAIDLKQTAFLPYVSAVRLLAMKEGIQETSTIDRIEALLKRGYPPEFQVYLENFERLLEIRNHLFRHTQSYEASHFIPIRQLDRSRKKELREILKNGLKLHHYVRSSIG
ncbi:DUF294 nucleotidyltransferase-like domain-containing protein [Bacillus sinesaloumensis]|uniref:DUF294 nucleotidyltransferase-like domain-containing protein n=1 Tax=Litchfieldia sinesaloumensis TaxID=1926280 RepID=UPI0009888D85|nr:DUF294 nucleotidyltransferase-like domain-containing protein [Bacillus sinesaloumensis]